MAFVTGDRVQLVSTTDEYTKLTPGDLGTVSFVDGLGTIHVNWDSGSRLGMVPGEDELIAAGAMMPYQEL
jgi:Domain of unknown function (DUF4314)